MLRNFALSTLCISVLTACGGSSNNDAQEVETPTTPPVGSPSPDTTELTITVIDGYLSNAEVCVIPAGSSECELLGTTDENGQVTVPGDTTGQLIATIESGKTTDADRVGLLPNNYQMAATLQGGDSTDVVITPFTTIADLHNDKDLAAIAADFNLPVELIAGDYVASTLDEQAHAHALARALTAELSISLDDNQITPLYQAANQINQYIVTELANTDVDLDTVTISLSDDAVSHETLISSLDQYLQGQLYLASTNYLAFQNEGVMTLSFNNGELSLNGGESRPYTIDGNVITFGGESDSYIYVSQSMALQVPHQFKDLVITSTTNIDQISLDWTTEDFVGETLHFLHDDSFCEGNCDPNQPIDPEPTLSELIFSDTQVTITEGNGQELVAPWHIDNGQLVLELTAVGNSRDIIFGRAHSDLNVTVAMDIGAGRAPHLFFSNRQLAEAVLLEWVKI